MNQRQQQQLLLQLQSDTKRKKKKNKSFLSRIMGYGASGINLGKDAYKLLENMSGHSSAIIPIENFLYKG